jgi:hypothetical protein
LENRRVEQVLSGRVGNSVGEEEVEKGCKRVQIPCTHVCKWKMRAVETIPEMRGGKNNEEWWRG